MPTYEAIVDENGRVTLPKELTDKLEIKPGQQVEFFLTLDGQVHFHAISRSAGSFGDLSLPKRRPSLSIREMDDVVAEHLAEEDDRIKRQARPGAEAKRSAAE